MAFMIIGHLGTPLYELLDFAGTKREDVARNAQFLLHAALDSVDLAAALPTATSTYLKVVDRHQEQLVSAYVTPGGARFLVLHDARNEEGIRAFCNEVHELYIKVLLNPFYAPGSRIDSADFDARVQDRARRYVGFKG